MFPNGNKKSGTVSAFLECLDASLPQPEDWHVCGTFMIGLCRTSDPSIMKCSPPAPHRFALNDTDWGFSSVCQHEDLVDSDPTQSILEKDTLNLFCILKVFQDVTGTLYHNFVNWDSKAKTGYIGLKNQGATCYLNSLLQSLYFTNYFRKVSSLY